MASDAPASTDIPPEVLAVLVLPDPADMVEDMRRGALCVWCTTLLTLESAVDLGELKGSVGRWWPRSCPACVAGRAHRGLYAHVPQCEQCVDEAALCPVGRVLYRLVREGRR
ncbi:hypothetical protein [Streptomyces sp. SID10815]|uniref:hypothetical protein n=1 Tax=Streptomyces sp. SID10815 TaxID=2706027 RepID=UPI001944D60D|nr:hypothetical protein [Streptomyces sp. SID10815]